MEDFVNTLYTNDNLFVLHGLNSNSVDLIYLDPPFNSNRDYFAPIGSKAAGSSFKDMWTWEDVNEAYLETLAFKYPALTEFIAASGVIHSKAMMAYLTYMAQRIVEMHRVLKDTGSIYLHCDPSASHYLKVVMDEIFGKDNFRNEISWCYHKWTNKSNAFQHNHDIIYFYTKSNKYTFNKLENDKAIATHYEKGYHTNTIAGGTSQLIVYDAKKAKAQIESGKYDKIVYREGVTKVVLPDWWEISILNSQSKERTGYPTQKPLALLHRIIKASSNPGDIVLDPFCGCATTCVAAEQLGRRWIGIDIAEQAVRILMERLSAVTGLGFNGQFINRRDLPQRKETFDVVPIKSIKERLYKEQNGACNGCKGEFRIQHLEIDHIIPKSRGGGDYYENYQLLCGHCNRMKGNRPMEYLRMRHSKANEELNKIIFGG